MSVGTVLAAVGSLGTWMSASAATAVMRPDGLTQRTPVIGSMELGMPRSGAMRAESSAAAFRLRSRGQGFDQVKAVGLSDGSRRPKRFAPGRLAVKADVPGRVLTRHHGSPVPNDDRGRSAEAAAMQNEALAMDEHRGGLAPAGSDRLRAARGSTTAVRANPNGDRLQTEQLYAQASAVVATVRHFPRDADTLYANMRALENRLQADEGDAADDVSAAQIAQLQISAERMYAAVAFADDDCNAHDATIELTRARVALDRAAHTTHEPGADEMAATADVAAEEALERQLRCAQP